MSNFIGKFQDLVNTMASADDVEADMFHGLFSDMLYAPQGLSDEDKLKVNDKLFEYGFKPE